MRVRRAAVALATLCASSCGVRVVRTLDAGRAIAIDPCSVVDQAVAETALGGPADRTLLVFRADVPTFGRCLYDRAPDNESLQVVVGNVVRESPTAGVNLSGRVITVATSPASAATPSTCTSPSATGCS